MQQFVEFYYPQILASGLAGAALGALVPCRLAWMLLFAPIASGMISLLATGDWNDFFKDGITIAHLIYLAGHSTIAVTYFGPFGLISAVLARGVRFLLLNRTAKRRTAL